MTPPDFNLTARPGRGWYPCRIIERENLLPPQYLSRTNKEEAKIISWRRKKRSVWIMPWIDWRPLNLFISPQSERSELGAFYFCPGVISGYCCVCESGYCCAWERGYCNCVCYMGVFKNVPNSRAVVVTLFDSDWLLCILMMLHYKRIVSSSYNHCHLHQWSVL